MGIRLGFFSNWRWYFVDVAFKHQFLRPKQNFSWPSLHCPSVNSVSSQYSYQVQLFIGGICTPCATQSLFFFFLFGTKTSFSFGFSCSALYHCAFAYSVLGWAESSLFPNTAQHMVAKWWVCGLWIHAWIMLEPPHKVSVSLRKCFSVCLNRNKLKECFFGLESLFELFFYAKVGWIFCLNIQSPCCYLSFLMWWHSSCCGGRRLKTSKNTPDCEHTNKTPWGRREQSG